MHIVRTFGSPLRLDGEGHAETVDDLAAIKNAIRTVVMMRRGEVLLLDAGSRVTEIEFDPRDDTTLGLLKEYIRDAVRLSLPQVFIKDVFTVLIEPTEADLAGLSVEEIDQEDHKFELFTAFSVPAFGIDDVVQISSGELT